MTELFSFGTWVRHRRRALDLTREELAPQVGCSVMTIRHIEADERRPSKQLDIAAWVTCQGSAFHPHVHPIG
jgi:DNA-binding XRE family transcriptional regulator